ncbi:MAG: hypothetical protein R3F37_17530 [Candidatus Competibacteraceae bacterium]
MVAQAVTRERSLLAAVDGLRGGTRTLRELDGRVPAILNNAVPAAAVIDPEQLLAAPALLAHFIPGIRWEGPAGLRLGKRVNTIALLGFGLALRWTPLAHWLDAGPDYLQRPLDAGLELLDTFKKR